jgi:hypothetical protein
VQERARQGKPDKQDIIERGKEGKRNVNKCKNREEQSREEQSREEQRREKRESREEKTSEDKTRQEK